MNVTDINVVLALLVVIGFAMALGVWVSPRALDWCVARLYARSRALEAARASYRIAYEIAMKEQTGE